MKGIMSYFSKKTALIFLILIFISSWGSYAFKQMHRDYLPPIKNANLMVTIKAPLFSQIEVQKQLTGPLSKQLHQLNHLETLESETYNHGLMLKLTYDSKADMEKARTYLKQSLNEWHRPEGVQAPDITMIQSTSFPIMEISLTPNKISRSQLLTKEKNQIQQAIEQLPGVQKVDVAGGADDGLVMLLHPKAMAKHHVTAKQLMDLLNEDVSFPHGLVKSGQEVLPFTITSDKLSPQLIENESIRTENGDAIKLGSLLKVEKFIVNQFVNVRTNGKAAVILSVYKTPSADITEVSHSVEDRIKQLPIIKSGDVSSKILSNKGNMVDDSLNNLFREGLLGCLFSIVSVWLFFRNYRLSLLVGISLPISFFLTMIGLHLIGKGINLLTLSGVIIAMGRVMDDSIVVIDNVLRKKGKGTLTLNHVQEGVASILPAVIASTLTTIVVFLPFAFVPGMIQQAISGFAWAVTFALLSSLLVSVVILPPFIIRFGSRISEGDSSDHFDIKARHIVSWCFKKRKILLPIFALLLISSIILSFHIPVQIFARSQQNDIVIQIEGPENNPMPTLNAETRNLEAFLKDSPGVKNYTATVGGSFRTTFDDVFDQNGGWVQRQNVANVVIQTKKGTSQQALISKINQYIGKLSTSATYAVSSQNISGDDSRVSIVLSGADEETLNHYSTRLKSKLAMIDQVFIYDAGEVGNSFQIKLNEEKMNEFGIKKQDIYDVVNPYLNIQQEGKIRTNDGEVPYELKQEGELPSISTASQDIVQQTLLQIGNTKLSGKNGLRVRLAEVASLDVHPGQVQVMQNGEPVSLIEGSILNKDPEKTARKIKEVLDHTPPPEGVTVKFGGFTKQMREMTLTIVFTSILALLLILMVIHSIFKGFRAPLAILLSLPMAISGSIIGLYFMKGAWNLGSIIGLVMLLGIAATNKIVLVDKIEKNSLSQSDLGSILDGTILRVRPVIMTALTTVMTMLPLMILGNDQEMVSRSLAISVIFGMITSTFTTLLIVPSVYHWMLQKRDMGTGSVSR
ncbi:efflux RND transporter permease subunit [Falsibacillus pallidus]|uniref:efflux RND transporter permease subunit n=1 Tax=Falsibacillus pallidus TaxID=493781 RepID=UPI003D9663D5